MSVEKDLVFSGILVSFYEVKTERGQGWAAEGLQSCGALPHTAKEGTSKGLCGIVVAEDPGI